MELLKQQVTTWENIKSLCVNYKKDSISRKTIDYLERRLESLEHLWIEFHERHEPLVRAIEDKSGVNYFTDNVYQKTMNMYETTKINIMELLVHNRQQCKVEFDLTGMLEEETGDEIKETMITQECNFKALDRAMSKMDIEYLTEKWEIEDHLATLKSKWDNIDRLHWKLEGLLRGSHLKEEYYPKFENIEDKYNNQKKLLNKKLNSNIHYQRSAPQIDIPVFSGNYVQWLSFKDTFTDIIHNNPTISNCQKMQHLKTKLKGEAERLIQHLSINADNYLTCWDILTQRYDNRRLQFTSFMNMMNQLPVIQHPNSYNLKKMHDVITECLNGISNMGVETSNWDPVIVYYMSQKLDAATFEEYSREIKYKRDIPDLQEFLSFLENKFITLETNKKSQRVTAVPSKSTIFNKTVQKSIDRNNFNRNYNFKNYYETRNANENSNLYARNKDHSIYHTTFGKCPLCEGEHVLMQCDTFVSMDSAQRNSTVAKLKVCKNCLYSHGTMTCNSTKSCKECNMKHHTLLHLNKPSNKKGGNDIYSRPSTSQPSHHEQQSAHYTSADDIEILLTTIQVRVQANNGTFITLRALLDQGSQVNLITENAAQRLELHRKKLNASVSGIGSASRDCKGVVQFTAKSIHSDFTINGEALILRQITNKLPNHTIRKANWPHINNLRLADPDYNVSSNVDLLLGADIYADIILDGVLKGDHHSPIAQQTQLGWILCGKLKTFNCHVTVNDLSDLAKYWETEDITKGTADISQNDHCEIYYKNTTVRAPDGKYIVKMPMIPNYEKQLGASRSIAVSQFTQLEKRLQKNENLSSMYKSFIEEYANLKHMTPGSQVPFNSEKPECYLPHHGVLRENSTTTKLRVVFNASQKTTSGKSLNCLMEKGPNLQKDLQELILKWRTYKHVFTADIEKMYRCIWISKDQQPLQKIVWRDSPSENLQEYTLCTVTYGTKCAPWLAMRTLRQLAIDDGHKYPAAAKILQTEFYVDDLISGHNSLETAKQLQNALIRLLEGGGMNLRKWSSNSPALLEHLETDQISKSIYNFKQDDSLNTLGIRWTPSSDTFTFNWNLKENSKKPLTKRSLLSQISQMYDPLGWLAPVTITAKLLFQRVWAEKLEWDEELPPSIQESWLKLKSELPKLKTIKINRWIGSTNQNIELLGFCDASERAYSCIVYTRSMHDVTQTPVITLLTAKTRVAPLSQKISLPRLELCGALLLAQLIKKVKDSLKEHTIKIRAWSDSKVVLAWLQADETKWERYIENRAMKIREVIPANSWFYVDSKNNPADCATRGLYPDKLLNFKLWWKGPDELLRKVDNLTKITSYSLTTVIDKKQTETALEQNDSNILNNIINKYSSLTRAIRVLAWILRFIKRRTRAVKDDPDGAILPKYLTINELNEANIMFIKYTQRCEFKLEYNILLKNKTLSHKSSIYKLNPYLDKHGIIRVGGRLNKANIPVEMKNPIILPRYGNITNLLINQAHYVTLHGGARLTLAYLRQRYWIVGGNRAVKTQLRRCVRCHRFNASKNYQIMADLPAQRVTPSRPFTHTGVDFTGHIEVKLNKGRGVRTSKGYICIFICMVTKAVHIELVSDLSSEAFLAAFQRMCARRGTPKHVYSDCGTNFIGASKILKNEYESFKKELSIEFFDELSKMEVEWHFNAPAWPTAGGLWEAAVRSMKHHLRRVLGDQKLTYEEFTTLLNKIEACMNSRPLCPLTEDPQEFSNYLTPGHFLTGTATMTLPLHSNYEEEKNVSLRQRWQLTEQMFNRFWKLWSSDYLTQLQARSKWQKQTRNMEKGDIVLVKDNNLPPGKWALGRVTEVHPGSDGHVRVATIKTQTSKITRPITKLSPLPIETSTSTNLSLI